MVSISGITGALKTVYNYGKQVLKATPELTFGTSAEAVGSAMRGTYTSSKSITEAARAGWKEINKAANSGNFFKKMWVNIKNLIPDLKTAISDGAKLAETTGGNKILGAIKGLGKGIGKKLPFLFAAFMLVGEIPNIVKATKEKGIWQGIKETIKPIVRLVGAGIGSAVGTAILPFGGSLVGWVAGEWLAGKLVGKSYTEKKAKEEKQREQIIAEMQQQGVLPQQQTAIPQQTGYPQISTFPAQNAYSPVSFNGLTNPFNNYSMQSNPYSDDIFMKQMNFNTVV